jgi:hypothetical protein
VITRVEELTCSWPNFQPSPMLSNLLNLLVWIKGLKVWSYLPGVITVFHHRDRVLIRKCINYVRDSDRCLPFIRKALSSLILHQSWSGRDCRPHLWVSTIWNPICISSLLNHRNHDNLSLNFINCLIIIRVFMLPCISQRLNNETSLIIVLVYISPVMCLWLIYMFSDQSLTVRHHCGLCPQ